VPKLEHVSQAEGHRSAMYFFDLRFLQLSVLVALVGCVDRQTELQSADPEGASTSSSSATTLTGTTHDFDSIFVQIDQLDLFESGSVVNVFPQAVVDFGAIWITDSTEAQVRKYTRSGKLLLSFGVRGEGPGELSSPIQALPLSSDTLLVVDQGRLPRFGLGLYEVSASSASFLGYVNPDDAASRFLMGRRLPDGRIVMGSAADPNRMPMGVSVGRIRSDVDSTTENFIADFEAIDINNSIPAEMIDTYRRVSPGLTVIDVQGTRLAAASAFQDTIHVHSLPEEGPASTFPLPTNDFRQMPALSAEGFSAAWRASYSGIADLFVVSDDVIVVQYNDLYFRDPEQRNFQGLEATYSLVGVSLDGSPLFQIKNTPRLLAWDNSTQQFLGYRETDSLPNQMAWYSLRLPTAN
jgi:hypothetical protein